MADRRDTIRSSIRLWSQNVIKSIGHKEIDTMKKNPPVTARRSRRDATKH
jgi:hypothetical protein